MLMRNVKTANTGNDNASCFPVSSPSPHRTSRGGGVGGACFKSGGGHRVATGLCPLDDLVEQGGGLARAVDHDVAVVEQIRRRFGRGDAHTRVRALKRADVLEHRPVVLVVAEADDAAWILAWEQGR